MTKYKVYFEKVYDTETYETPYQDFASEIHLLTTTTLTNLAIDEPYEFYNSFKVEVIPDTPTE